MGAAPRGSQAHVGFLLGSQVFPGGRVLTLASARASDSGSYSCVAVSAVGEDRRDVVLFVHSKSQARVLSSPGQWLKKLGLGAPPPHPESEGLLDVGGTSLRLWLPSLGVRWRGAPPSWAGGQAAAQPGAPSVCSGSRQRETWQEEH